jgi:hypothetical protein
VPSIPSLSFRQAFPKLAFKTIPINETLLSPPFLLEIHKISLVFLPCHDVDTVTFALSHFPLTIITVSKSVCPNPDAVTIAVLPFSNVIFTIKPLKLSIPVSFLIQKLAFVCA